MSHVPSLPQQGEQIEMERTRGSDSNDSGEKARYHEKDMDADHFAGPRGVLAADVEAVGAMVDKLDLKEARAIIQQTLDDHRLDPNFPKQLLARAAAALAEEELHEHTARALIEEIKVEAALMDDSPYPEVRAVVPNTDDPTMPVSTFRAWVIGLVFALIGTGVNIFFTARNPPITLSTFVAQLLAFPAGKFFERILPTKPLFGRFSLNPGPFNMKEHMLITIMANVTFGGIVGVYSTDIIVVQRIPRWFNQNALASQAGYQIMLTLSTQLIGFSLAGLSRRFLVYPPAMIWPTNLATIALNRSFHAPGNPVANGWRISRLRFFLIVFFVYGFLWVLPDAVMQCLGYFNWPTWIAPNNKNLAIIGGQISGLGLINPWPSFDWSYLNVLNYPMITPLFSTINQTMGALIIGIFFIIPIYYTNTWYTSYIPINTNHVFDNTGSPYNVSRILDDTFSLDATAYEAYSPPYLSAGNSILYGAFFALYTATIVYVALHHHKELKVGVRAAFNWTSGRAEYKDVHNRLMEVYPEVPEWWFAAVLLICFALGVATIEHYHTDVPVWAIVFAVILAILFVVPVGIIQAVTNTYVTLNVIAEMIGGYAIPGKPLANMIFKTFGFITTAQAVGYAGDLKLAHYVKLPPRTVFFAQFWASLLACFVGVGVVDWQIGNIPDFCDSHQKNLFTCPGYNTFFTAGVIWGTLGPKRMYSVGAQYAATTLGFLVGAILPVPVWFLARRYPGSSWKLVHIPALLYGALGWAPYNFSYFYGSLWFALFFMGYVRRYYLPWWSKYNYVLATALQSSVAIFAVLWFFSILYKEYQPDWNGNNIPFTGLDGSGTVLKDIPEIGYFGPGPGEFHA